LRTRGFGRRVIHALLVALIDPLYSLFLLASALLETTAGGSLVSAAANAPEGYEDEEGFHFLVIVEPERATQ